MRRIIFALFTGILLSSAAIAVAQTKPLELAADAPDRYVVLPGDTLWSLSSKFLKDPYRWGELWNLNREDIKNPQLIYPGQVLTLNRSKSTPSLEISTVKLVPREYIEQFKRGIPSISPAKIEPYLIEPLVTDDDVLAEAARVVANDDGRVLAGAGDLIYTTPVEQNPRLWQIFRPATPLIDPVTKEVLGYQALLLGTARWLKTGQLSEFRVLSSKQEILTGDRLLPAPSTEINSYLPHAPDKMISGQVIGIPGGVEFAGTNMVVTINRGKRDGLERGHVLVTEFGGGTVKDRGETDREILHTYETYQLPDNRNGLMFVFRVYERVSYALVMGSRRVVTLGDPVRTP